MSGIYQLTPFSHLGITFPNLFIAGSVQLNWWHISYLKWVSTATPNEYSFYFTVIVICVFLFILIVTPSWIYWNEWSKIEIYILEIYREFQQVWRGALILWESLEYYQTHLVPRRRQTFFNYYNSNVRNEISFLRFTVIFGRSSLNENRSLSRPSFLILKCREIQRILKCEYWFFLPFLKCLFYGTYSHEIINTLCLFWDPFLSKLKQTIQVDFTVEIACS